MRILLLVGLIGLPVLEIALLVRVGQWLGFWPTLALVVGTGLLGSFLISRQGLATLRKAQAAVERGEAPIGPMVDGIFIAIAGALLISPGVVTDVLGVLLLVPPVRRWIAAHAVRHLAHNAEVHVTTFEARRGTGAAGPGHRHDGRRAREPEQGPARETRGEPRGEPRAGPVIEGEFERIDERTVDRGDPRTPRGR